MLKKISLFLLISVSCIFVACSCKIQNTTNSNGKLNNSSPTSDIVANVSPTSVIADELDSTNDTIFNEEPKPEVMYGGENYQLIKLGFWEGYNDYYECIVFDKNHKAIYVEILGPISNPPDMSVQDNEVKIHRSAGTDAYSDKFIDFNNNRKSDWLDCVRAVGNEYVAYEKYEKTPEGDDKKVMVIAKKYEQNSERIYPFPFDYKGFIDKCEFRDNETELYIHYLDDQLKNPSEITIKLSEFK